MLFAAISAARHMASGPGIVPDSPGRPDMQLVQVMLSIAFLAHVVACGWFATGTLFQPDRPACWLSSGWYPKADAQPADELPRARQYLYSLYWALSTLLTVGYGDVTPTSDGEIVFAMMAMLFGATSFAAMTGAMASQLQSYSLLATLRRQRLQQLDAYLGKAFVPAELARRVKACMARQLDHHILHEDTVLDGLPPWLRAELRLSSSATRCASLSSARTAASRSSGCALCSRCAPSCLTSSSCGRAMRWWRPSS